MTHTPDQSDIPIAANPVPLVLVVDDEAHIHHVVSLKLRHAGFEVVTAEDGEQGLEAALQRTPDLVVTDLQMPFMDGLEMCRRLKQHPDTASVPALMLTARGFSIPEEAIGQTNIVEVFSKPFSPKEILGSVEALIAPRHPLPSRALGETGQATTELASAGQTTNPSETQRVYFTD